MPSDQPVRKLHPADIAAPTLLALLACTRLAPLAVPAMMLMLHYLPGRLVARMLGLDRSWDVPGRVILAVAFSLAVTPVLLNPVWHVTNHPWALLAAVWGMHVAGAIIAGLSGRRTPELPASSRITFERRRTRVLAGIVAVLVIVYTIGPYWPTELRGYPVPCLIHDFVKHHAVLYSLEHAPLPLRSPFYASGADEPVYYYHFFYLAPATLRAVAPSLSPELAFGLCSAMVALATAGMFYLTVRRFTGHEAPATLGLLLCTLIGTPDILGVLLFGRRIIMLDAWADHAVRIHPFLFQMIWSPQNTQGVLIGLLTVHFLSVFGWWRGWVLWGPLLGAGLVGTSVWVAMPFFAGAALYVASEAWVRRGDRAAAARRFLQGASVGLLTAMACLPTLRGYAEMSTRHGKGLTMSWPRHRIAWLGRLVEPGIPANLLDLSWILCIELGPLLLLPVLLLPGRSWRRAWDDPGLRLLMLGGTVALCGFPVIRSHFFVNDFGQKSMLVAMSAGLVLAASTLTPAWRPPSCLNPLGWSFHPRPDGRPRRGLAAFAGILLVLSLPVSVYEAPLTVLRRHLPPSPRLGRIVNMAMTLAQEEASAYRFVRHALPTGAVLQGDWARPRFGVEGLDRMHLQQISRKRIGVLALDMDTMVFHPADMDRYRHCLEEVSGVLENETAPDDCAAVLRRWGITHVYVGTIEREAWRGLDKFDDPRYFTKIFEESPVTIYEVLP